jgi:hypothetical protein
MRPDTCTCGCIKIEPICCPIIDEEECDSGVGHDEDGCPFCCQSIDSECEYIEYDEDGCPYCDDKCKSDSDCTEGQVCCDGECMTPPTPDSQCEKLSDDKCSIVPACTPEQECCDGECKEYCECYPDDPLCTPDDDDDDGDDTETCTGTECCGEDEMPCGATCCPFGEVCVRDSETFELYCYGGCVCQEVKLYKCPSGEYSRIICCDPTTDPDGCHGKCMPREWWDAKDQTEECVNEEEIVSYKNEEPPTTIGDDFIEPEETEVGEEK